MKQITDRERIEIIFGRAEKVEAEHLLDIAGLILRTRFPSDHGPATRVRKPAKAAPPVAAGGVE